MVKTTMEKALLDAYGPTMDLKEVARTMKRNPDAIRKTLKQSVAESPWWANALRHALLPVARPGQKLLFRTAVVASVLDTPYEQQTSDTLEQFALLTATH